MENGPSSQAIVNAALDDVFFRDCDRLALVLTNLYDVNDDNIRRYLQQYIDTLDIHNLPQKEVKTLLKALHNHLGDNQFKQWLQAPSDSSDKPNIYKILQRSPAQAHEFMGQFQDQDFVKSVLNALPDHIDLTQHVDQKKNYKHYIGSMLIKYYDSAMLLDVSAHLLNVSGKVQYANNKSTQLDKRQARYLLMWAVQQGKNEALKIMTFTSCSQVEFDGGQLIREVASCDDPNVSDIMQLLINISKKNVESLLKQYDNNGLTVLHYLAINKQQGANLLSQLKQNKLSIKTQVLTKETALTPLHFAANLGNQAAVEFLLSERACVDAQNNYLLTALHHAAALGRDAIVKQLLDQQATVNCQDKAGDTPLHLAAKSGKRRAMEKLLEYNASINVQNNEGYTPLHLAVINGNETVVGLLLGQPSINPWITDYENGSHPLLYACQEGYLGMVKLFQQHHQYDYFLELIKTVSQKTGHNALHFACMGTNHRHDSHQMVDKNKRAVASLILASNRDKDLVNRESSSDARLTPLGYAAFYGYSTLTRLIANMPNTEIDYLNFEGTTPLLKALISEYSNPETAIQLLDRGASIHYRTPGNETVLDLACKRDWLDAVGKVVELYEPSMHIHQPDQAISQTDMMSALRFACSNGYTQLCDNILNKVNPHLDYGDHNNNTALMLAAQNGHKTIVDKLLEQQWVDVNHQNTSQETALLVAIKRGYEDIVDTLLANDEKHYNDPSRQLTPHNKINALELAAKQKHFNVVEILLNHVLKQEQPLPLDIPATIDYLFQNQANNLLEQLINHLIQTDSDSVKTAFLKAAEYNNQTIFDRWLNEVAKQPEGFWVTSEQQDSVLHYLVRNDDMARVDNVLQAMDTVDNQIYLITTTNNRGYDALDEAYLQGNTGFLDVLAKHQLLADFNRIEGDVKENIKKFVSIKYKPGASTKAFMDWLYRNDKMGMALAITFNLDTHNQKSLLSQSDFLSKVVNQGYLNFFTALSDEVLGYLDRRLYEGLMAFLAEVTDDSLPQVVASLMNRSKAVEPDAMSIFNAVENKQQGDKLIAVLAQKRPRLLLSRMGSNLNTPLHIAIKNDNFKAVETLLQSNADCLYKPDRRGRSPLQFAITADYLQSLQTILECEKKNNLDIGLQLTPIDDAGQLPIHYAVKNKQNASELIDALARNACEDDFKASLDQRDSKGNTPLHLAIAEGNENAVKSLLAHAPNLKIRDHHRRTPLQLAQSQKKQNIVTMLKHHTNQANHGASAASNSHNFWSPTDSTTEVSGLSVEKGEEAEIRP